MATDGGHGPYPTTIWSDIKQLRQVDGEAARKVLDRILKIYYPLFQGQLGRDFHVSEDQATDWLQSFVWKKVVLKDLFASADPKKGRFRTFVINALKKFVLDEIEHAGRERRAPAGGFVPVEAIEGCDPAANETSVASSLDKAWGKGVLEAAKAQMRSECERKGNQRVWEVFHLRLLEPAEEGTEPPPYKELFARLGFRSDAEAGNALITAKRMFARAVRSVVAEYCRTGEEIEAEVRELMAIFAGL